jgi:putative spermidine/putrescine transport system ATP-binding protein
VPLSREVPVSPIPKLELVGVTKRYGATVALEPTSLTVEPGEFVTLLGPSGSGKTTLLMMVAGLTEVSGGRIVLDGADITRAPSHKREIGVIFQHYALFPHLSVFENVAFPLEMRRMPPADIEKGVKDALRLVRLDHLAARRPGELSGGQQQRVAFARAVVFRPHLVLMDEPLGALDKKLREELKGEIRRLHRELGTTVIYVTHDQDEAMHLSDRICLMNDAKVEQVGPPELLYARPATRFAAGFVGESNLLTGVVAGDGRVAAGGIELSTRHADRLGRSGAPVTVLIRPERIAIAAAGDNILAGTIADVIDLGVTRRLTVDIPGGPSLAVTTLGVGPRPTAGSAITLAVSADDVVPLPGGA